MGTLGNLKITKIAAQRIRKKRKSLGLTIDKLAELSGLSTQTIKTIERGERYFRIDTLAALARALGVSCDYILGLEIDDEKKNVEVLLNNLSPAEVNYLIKLLQDFSELLFQRGEESNDNNSNLR